MKTIIGCSLILVLSLAVAPVYVGALQDGMDAYKLEDFRTAFKKLNPPMTRGCSTRPVIWCSGRRTRGPAGTAADSEHSRRLVREAGRLRRRGGSRLLLGSCREAVERRKLSPCHTVLQTGDGAVRRAGLRWAGGFGRDHARRSTGERRGGLDRHRLLRDGLLELCDDPQRG